MKSKTFFNVQLANVFFIYKFIKSTFNKRIQTNKDLVDPLAIDAGTPASAYIL